MGHRSIFKTTLHPTFVVVLRYGLAFSLVAIALTISVIPHFRNSPPRFVSHFVLIAIAITFWCAGTGPGLFALLLSCLGVSFLATNHLLTPDFPLGPFIIFFVVFSALIGWFSASLRRARHLLTEAHDTLELQVTERTSELVRANDELQKTHAVLRSREAYLADAQELSHTGSFVWDVCRQETIYWSAEMFRIHGRDPAQGPPSVAEESALHSPEDWAGLMQATQKATKEKIEVDYDSRLILPDGTTKYIHIVAHPVVQDTGDATQFIGTTMDVTEQHLARTALNEAFEKIKKLKDELYQENLALKEEIDQAFMFEEIVGSSEVLRRVLVQLAKVAQTESTVLILGETGTGKELIARAIHKRSNRSTRAFIRVNCAAIPPSLIASELFGHEKGAFTGALQRRVGRFESADGGTIFLDEVGELPAETQVALLRVLQEREFERVGGSQSISVDVRVLAATNCDLGAAVDDGTFRQDLFYRLNVFPITVPPLRDRLDDIPLLVEYLIERYAKKAGKNITNITKRTMEIFQAYDWPGNVRELQNVVERAIVLCEGKTFSVDERWLKREVPQTQRHSKLVEQGLGRLDTDQEKKIIETALAESNGRIAGPGGAAEKLGVPRSTLESKIRALRINKHVFKP